MPEYPEVVMAATPDDTNVWHTVMFNVVQQNVLNPDCLSKSCDDIVITQHPISKIYDDDTELTDLTVTVTGGSNLVYTWYKWTGANDVKVGEGESYSPNVSTMGTSYYYVKLSNEECESVSRFAVITINSVPNSVETISNKNEIKVYPNPTTGIVYITMDNGQWTMNNAVIRVYNMQGVLLKTTLGTEVDLSGYPTGVYILQINGESVRVIKN